jgi:hypothetical protein
MALGSIDRLADPVTIVLTTVWCFRDLDDEGSDDDTA